MFGELRKQLVLDECHMQNYQNPSTQYIIARPPGTREVVHLALGISSIWH